MAAAMSGVAAGMPASTTTARTNSLLNVLNPTSPGSTVKRRQTIHPAASSVAVGAAASPGNLKSTSRSTTGGSTLKRRSASMTAVEISRHAAVTDENGDGSSLSPRSGLHMCRPYGINGWDGPCRVSC